MIHDFLLKITISKFKLVIVLLKIKVGINMNDVSNLMLGNEICFPLYVCSKGIISKYKPFLEELDLTYTQYIAMSVLWENRKMTVNELGKHLYLDSGTLTPLLKKLESKGLVTRKRSKEDERKTIIKITNKGLSLQDKAISVPSRVNDNVNLDG